MRSWLIGLALSTGALAPALGFAQAAPATAVPLGDLSTVNRGIHVPAGVRAGELESVNGAIRVDDGASFKSAEAVNGAIALGARVTASGGLETVNGRIEVDSGSRIGGRIETVNGSVQLDGATVTGGIETVNGGITLLRSSVGGSLETVNGDLRIGSGSAVRGDLIVRRPHGWFSRSRRPRVTIEANATVEGRLLFEREVTLVIDPAARVAHPKPVSH